MTEVFGPAHMYKNLTVKTVHGLKYTLRIKIQVKICD
jgi:hypothetical protein